jgi:hypothetical protein
MKSGNNMRYVLLFAFNKMLLTTLRLKGDKIYF